MKNQQEHEGSMFLTWNKDKYTLRLTEAQTGMHAHAQRLELCRANKDGEFTPLFTLDMSAIYSQCAPLHIINRLISDIGATLQCAGLQIDNHEYESARDALKDYRSNTEQPIFETTQLITEIINEATAQPENDPFNDFDPSPFENKPDMPF